jgi:hypothetical protein
MKFMQEEFWPIYFLEALDASATANATRVIPKKPMSAEFSAQKQVVFLDYSLMFFAGMELGRIESSGRSCRCSLGLFEIAIPVKKQTGIGFTSLRLMLRS